jgi:FAD/FMN-containing dehydrogenase
MTGSLVDKLRRAGVDGELIGPEHDGYDQGRRIWNGLIDRRPEVIVRPVGVEDVRRTVLVATESGLPLAVRGGGHSFPGHSTCDDGLVLDLSSMRTVTVDRERGVARAGGGALLGDVDAAGMPHDLVVPAGVVSHTGVGGLTLGGGMGWNSRRYGLTIDNLRSVELAMADGSVVTADAAGDPDLFWAIRGGGGNFGVVTSFEYELRPLGSAAVEGHIYAARDAHRVLADYAELTASAPRELSSGFTISQDYIRLRTMWFGAQAYAEGALLPFRSLGGAEPAERTSLSFWQLQRTSDEALPWGRRYYAKGGFLAGVDGPVVDWLAGCV